MPMYMTRVAYTAQAWADMAREPQDRTSAAAAGVRAMGGRLVDLYFCFGEDDSVAIYEAADDVTAAAIVVGMVARGHIKRSTTTRLLSASEGLQVMQRVSRAAAGAAPDA
jgi:uncharacterized protein with GYD domain